MDQSRRFVVPGQNRLLSSLPRDVQIRLLPRMEKISFGLKQILYDAGQPIAHVYFPLSGVISLLIALKAGETVEVATTGNEGLVGTPLLLGTERSSFKAVCQVTGQALKMRADAFRRSVEEHPELGALVRRYAQALVD